MTLAIAAAALLVEFVVSAVLVAIAYRLARSWRALGKRAAELRELKAELDAELKALGIISMVVDGLFDDETDSA